MERYKKLNFKEMQQVTITNYKNAIEEAGYDFNTVLAAYEEILRDCMRKGLEHFGDGEKLSKYIKEEAEKKGIKHKGVTYLLFALIVKDFTGADQLSQNFVEK